MFKPRWLGNYRKIVNLTTTSIITTASLFTYYYYNSDYNNISTGKIILQSNIQAEETQNYGKMKIIKSTPDGNCLFRSISKGLYNTEEQHIQLRLLAVQWMKNNLDYEIEKGLLLKHTLALDEMTSEMNEKERNLVIDRYLRRMNSVGVWGDYNCIVALSNCLNPKTNFKIVILSNHNFGAKRGQRKIDSIVDVKTPSSSTTTTTNTSITINQNNQYCKQHQGQAIEVYCKDCDIAICLKCALFNHQLHKLIDIQQIIKEEQENVYKLLEILDSKKETLLQRNKNIEITINNLIEQVELNVNEIKKYIRDLHNAVENALEVLILKIYEIGDDKLRSLQNEQQLLKDHYESLKYVN
ncbi:hypothetical protein ABK040_008423 [Willaertia magna]